jgi:hypothetical protein
MYYWNICASEGIGAFTRGPNKAIQFNRYVVDVDVDNVLDVDVDELKSM